MVATEVELVTVPERSPPSLNGWTVSHTVVLPISMPAAPPRAPRSNATGARHTSRNGGITVAESAFGQYPGAAIWVHISFDIHLVFVNNGKNAERAQEHYRVRRGGHGALPSR